MRLNNFFVIPYYIQYKIYVWWRIIFSLRWLFSCHWWRQSTQPTRNLNIHLWITANTSNIQLKNTLSKLMTDTFSECSEFKKKTLKSKLDFNPSFFNMVFLTLLILSSSMIKIKHQDSCLPMRATMYGSEITEVINIQEITPL